MSTNTPPNSDQMRADFEREMLKNGYYSLPDNWCERSGAYTAGTHQSMWVAWKCAIAHHEASKEKECVDKRELWADARDAHRAGQAVRYRRYVRDNGTGGWSFWFECQAGKEYPWNSDQYEFSVVKPEAQKEEPAACVPAEEKKEILVSDTISDETLEAATIVLARWLYEHPEMKQLVVERRCASNMKNLDKP